MTDIQNENVEVVTAQQTPAVQVEQPKKKMLGLIIPGWIIYGIILIVAAYVIYAMFDAVESDRIARENAAQNGGNAVTLATPLMFIIGLIYLVVAALVGLVPTGLGVAGLVTSLKKKYGKGKIVQFSLMTALPLFTCAMAFVVLYVVANGGGLQIG